MRPIIQRCLRGSPRVVLALAAGGLTLPAPGALQGQQYAPPVAVASRQGWIGIIYDGDGRGAPALRTMDGHTGLVVVDVVAGSPAMGADLRPGDLILAMDGESLSSGSRRMLLLREGETVRVRLLREGRVLESRLVAGPRPPESVLAGLQSRAARVDSLRIRIIQEMDSLLERDQRLGRSHSIINLYHSDMGGEPVHRVRSPRPDGEAPPSPGVSLSWVFENAGADGVGVPFGAFVLSRNRVEGLVTELQGVRGALEELRAEEMAHQRELALRQVDEGSSIRADAALQRVREARRQLLAEAQRLEGEMRMEGRRSIEREAPPLPPWTPLPAPAETRRPLSPYVLGQRVVAGAEVTALNPELAAYFGGEEGLLVLLVLPGSPASEAGFQAGDIVTRMGDRRVETVDQARSALESSSQGPIPVTLVRRGRSVMVNLPR